MTPKNRLKIILAEKEVQGVDLAEMLGVSLGTVYSWSNNKKHPSIKNLYRIAVALNVPVCSLLANANKKPSEIEAVNN